MSKKNQRKVSNSTAIIPIYPILQWGYQGSDSEHGKSSDGFEYAKVDLLAQPNDPDSQTAQKRVVIWETGVPEQYCRWRESLDEVFTGQNLTTGPQRYGAVLLLMKGTAKDTFRQLAYCSVHGAPSL